MNEILIKTNSNSNLNYTILNQNFEKSKFVNFLDEKDLDDNEIEEFLLNEFLNTLPKNERTLIEKQKNANENTNLLDLVNKNENPVINNNEGNRPILNENENRNNENENNENENVLYERRSSLKIVGLNKNSLGSFPKCPFKETKDMSDEDKMCSICWSNFNLNEIIKILFCLHRFHENCVDKWLLCNSLCPICKKDMKEEINKI